MLCAVYKSTIIRTQMVRSFEVISNWFNKNFDVLMMVTIKNRSMGLQPFVGPWWSFTQSIGLFGRGMNPSQGRYLHTRQHRQRKNPHRHSCLEWDSNPRFQCLSERKQFVTQSAPPTTVIGTIQNVTRIFWGVTTLSVSFSTFRRDVIFKVGE
jgi:hypothetical protein